MGYQQTPNYRGKGISRDKLTKSGEPKHAGNFSYSTIHAQSLQSQDYKVRRIDGVLIVGDHTPLSQILNEHVCAMTDNPHFSVYVEEGVKTVGSKQYEALRSLKRHKTYGRWSFLDYEFIYHEQIYTDFDFDYNFPNY